MHWKQSVSNTSHFKVKVVVFNRFHHTWTLTLNINTVVINIIDRVEIKLNNNNFYC